MNKNLYDSLKKNINLAEECPGTISKKHVFTESGAFTLNNKASYFLVSHHGKTYTLYRCLVCDVVNDEEYQNGR